MTPVIIYPNAEKQLNNSNISCVIRTSRILKFDWLRPRLGMPHQTYAESLNQLVGSNNVLSHEKIYRYGLIVS